MIRFTKKQVMPEMPDKVFTVLSQDLELPPEELEYEVDAFKNVDHEIARETLSTVMRMHAAIKFPVICDMIDFRLMTEEKIIVVGHHREEMMFPLHEKFKKYNPEIIIGGMSIKAKRNAEKTFQNDPKCRIIFLSMSAGGIGITLTAASRIIIAEASWVPGDIDQASDRPHRIGQTETVFVDLVTIRGSIDEYQLKRALEKAENIKQLVKVSDMPRAKKPTTPREMLEALQTQIAGFLEALPGEEDDDKPAPKTRRSRRAAKPADDDEAPKTRRGRRSKPAEDDEEPAPKARRGRRSKPAEDDEPAPKTRRGRRSKPAEDDEPAPKTRRRSRKATEKPFDKVRRLASEAMEATSRADLEELLEDFEVDKISELAEEDYDEFCEACQELIDGE